MTLIEFFSEPLNYQYVQRALIAAMLIGLISGILGCFVVVRGMSFFGDALAHSIVPGVAAAFVFTGPGAALGFLAGIDEDLRLFAGGLVAGILSAIVVGVLTRDDRLKEDTAIGVVFVTMFALGIAIISSDPRVYGSREFTHILFGDILAISRSDLITTALCGGVVIGMIGLLYKELLLVSFDRDLAQTLRLPAEGLRMLLLVLMAVTIVASLQIIGVTLTLAMLVTPAATARLLTHRFHTMMPLSMLLGAAAGCLGIFLSYHLDLATGPTIVLTSTALFLGAFAWAQWWQRVTTV
jgi:manganese/iron transport system permease protein